MSRNLSASLPRRRALATIAAGLAAIPALGRAQSIETIRIGITPVEQIVPLAYAMRAGLFERAGIKLDPQKIGSGAAIAAALAGGALDVGLTSMLAVLLGHVRGIPFTIIAPSGLFLPDTQAGLIVLKTSALHTGKDFNGKTIQAAAVNDINSLAMWCWMDQNGGDSSTIKVVEMPQAAAPEALEQGRVDGITVSNPAFTRAISTGKTRFVANIFSAIAPRILLVCWFSTNGWVERNRDVATRFGKVVAEAATYCDNHVDETVDDLVTLTGLDRSLAVQMKRTCQTPTVKAAEIQPMIDAAARYKMLSRAFPASEIIAPTAPT